MTAYLAYSYNTCLTEEQQTEIDEKTKKSREEFSKGFVKGTYYSLTFYFLYKMSTSAAYAADGKAPNPPKNTEIQPAPTQKPGFKPLADTPKNTFVGGFGAVCAAALQSGDFVLGLGCAFLLVVTGIVMNRL